MDSVPAYIRSKVWIIVFFQLKYSCLFIILYQFQACNVVSQHFYRLCSIKSYYKIMAIIPCAIQNILIAYLFYTQQFVSVTLISLTCLPLFSVINTNLFLCFLLKFLLDLQCCISFRIQCGFIMRDGWCPYCCILLCGVDSAELYLSPVSLGKDTIKDPHTYCF